MTQSGHQGRTWGPVAERWSILNRLTRKMRGKFQRVVGIPSWLMPIQKNSKHEDYVRYAERRTIVA
jgi:hypothetical protein